MGGKLLKGLTANEESNRSKLINLLRINAHFCVLMDSDKKLKPTRLTRQNSESKMNASIVEI